jgi:predicted PurR-regulated permease PerM
MDALTLAGFLGLVCTKLVDAIKHAFSPRKVPPSVSVLLSVGFGVLFVALLRLNLFKALAVEGANVSGAAPVVLTGLIVGGLGSGFYEALDVVSSKTSEIKKRAKVRGGQREE